MIEQRRQQYNTVRPHAALGVVPPALGAYTPVLNAVSQTRAVI